MKVNCIAKLTMIVCLMVGSASVANSQSITSDNFRPKPAGPVSPAKTKPANRSKTTSKRSARRDPSLLTDIRNEPAAIQEMHRMIVWFAPVIHALPRGYGGTLGLRIENGMYDILEELVTAKGEKNRSERLEGASAKLVFLRHQTWLLLDLNLIDRKSFSRVSGLIDGVGVELRGWMKQ